LFNTRRISSRVTEKKEKRGNKGKEGQARSGETGWAGYKARVEQMIDGGGTQERKGGKEREKEKVAYQEAFRSSAQGWTLVSTKTLSLIRVRFECPKDSGRKRKKRKNKNRSKKRRKATSEKPRKQERLLSVKATETRPFPQL